MTELGLPAFFRRGKRPLGWATHAKTLGELSNSTADRFRMKPHFLGHDAIGTAFQASVIPYRKSKRFV
jgi:hypothetical protein